jgi:hypothetical protein
MILSGAQQKRPWSKPGPEGRKGVIAFSRAHSKVFFGVLRGVVKEFSGFLPFK